MYFEVDEDDLSIAIGRKGINARLTSRLLGWKLDIGKVEVKEVGFDERKEQAAKALTSVGIEFELADRLVAVGLVSPEAFEGVTAEDLAGLGFTTKEAEGVLAKVTPVGETSPAEEEDANEEIVENDPAAEPESKAETPVNDGGDTTTEEASTKPEIGEAAEGETQKVESGEEASVN